MEPFRTKKAKTTIGYKGTTYVPTFKKWPMPLFLNQTQNNAYLANFTQQHCYIFPKSLTP
jgi:hypothetical protein